MRLNKIMTTEVACCTRDTSLQEVARKMVEHDCGAIPVLESTQNRKPIGMVTDRDITCRVLAMGKNPLGMKAGDCMTSPVITVAEDTTIDDCCDLMEKEKLRRIIVVDDAGKCCGIVAQADIARHAAQRRTAHVVREVSEPVGA